MDLSVTNKSKFCEISSANTKLVMHTAQFPCSCLTFHILYKNNVHTYNTPKVYAGMVCMKMCVSEYNTMYILVLEFKDIYHYNTGTYLRVDNMGIFSYFYHVQDLIDC